jgi:thiol-disulfide isomerase/thioredoxin
MRDAITIGFTFLVKSCTASSAAVNGAGEFAGKLAQSRNTSHPESMSHPLAERMDPDTRTTRFKSWAHVLAVKCLPNPHVRRARPETEGYSSLDRISIPAAKGPVVHPGFPLPAGPSRFAPLLALMLFVRPSLAGDMRAPAFSVKTVEGRTMRLTDMKNRPVVIDFWATWCAPCRASMPHLNDVSAKYANRGLAVVGMSVDETGPAPVKRFANQLGVRFPIAMANDDVLDAYGPIRVIPTTFFINREGTIVRRVVGYIDSETMDGYVREILP